jgi:hypothetical protein
MALFDTKVEILSFSSALLLLLLNVHTSLGQLGGGETHEDPGSSPDSFTPLGEGSVLDSDRIAAAAMYNFRLCTMFNLLDDDLGFWVKSRSTTWFCRFLLSQYGKERWI